MTIYPRIQNSKKKGLIYDVLYLILGPLNRNMTSLFRYNVVSVILKMAGNFKIWQQIGKGGT
jgi:hypothetical protein